MNPEDMARLSGLLGLLADPVRAGVLFALDADADVPVAELAALAGAGEAEVEPALRVLAAAGLATCTGPPGSVRGRLVAGFPRRLLRDCLPQLVALTRRLAPL